MESNTVACTSRTDAGDAALYGAELTIDVHSIKSSKASVRVHPHKRQQEFLVFYACPASIARRPLQYHLFFLLSFFFYEKPRTSRTEYCTIEMAADATVVVKLEHLRRPEVSAPATLQCVRWITIVPGPWISEGERSIQERLNILVVFLGQVVLEMLLVLLAVLLNGFTPARLRSLQGLQPENKNTHRTKVADGPYARCTDVRSSVLGS